MSTSISIHDIDDETVEWLRREAEKRDSTVEQVALELIRQGIEHSGLPTYDDLDDLAGTWSDQEADEFLSSIADLEEVDQALWQ